MDPAYAAVHADEDRAHWWFLGRRAVWLWSRHDERLGHRRRYTARALPVTLRGDS